MPFNPGHALLIGVGTHQFHPGIDVPIAVADAQAVAAVLRNPTLCGYPPEQVQAIHDNRATKAGILAALDHLAERTGAEDTVFLFYCGHGALGTDGNYYLVSHDARIQGSRVLAGSGVSEGELLAKLRAIPAQRLFLVFNACHSGHISPSLDLAAETLEAHNPPEESTMALLGTGQGRILIVACREGQLSYIGPGETSIFTQELVDGLGGKGVRNSSGFISAFSLYEHVYEAVKEAVNAQLNARQEPELTVLQGVGPFAVSLYQGASTLGAFDSGEALPAGMAVRQVNPQQSAKLFRTRVVQTGGGAYVGGDVDTGGGDFIGRDKIVGGDEVRGDKTTGVKIGNVSGGIHGSVIAGGDVSDATVGGTTVFDQRGQKVNYQYNAAGDINLGAVQHRSDVIDQLEKLQAEIAQAVAGNALDEDTATDVEYRLKKAIQQAKKPEPDRKSIVDYLSEAKGLVAGVATGAAAVGGLVAALTQAIALVQKLF